LHRPFETTWQRGHSPLFETTTVSETAVNKRVVVDEGSLSKRKRLLQRCCISSDNSSTRHLTNYGTVKLLPDIPKMSQRIGPKFAPAPINTKPH
jgi:hypothetical protein